MNNSYRPVPQIEADGTKVFYSGLVVVGDSTITVRIAMPPHGAYEPILEMEDTDTGSWFPTELLK